MTSGNTAETLRSFWGHDLKYWKASIDLALTLSLGITGFSGVIVGITTWKSINWGDEISDFNERALRAYQLETQGKVADATKAGLEAGERAGHAQADVDAAKVSLAGANAEIAEGNVLAARLSKEAAEARLETEKLKSIMSWRTLSPVEFENIVSALSSSPSSVSFLVARDPESLELFNQLALAFFKAGIDTSGGSTMWGDPPILDSDVVIRGTGPDVDRIKRALESGGLKVSVEETGTPIQIGVLFKPRAKLVVPKPSP